MWRQAIAAFMEAVPGVSREEADEQAGLCRLLGM
jgi:hypothetical protein